MFDALIDGLGSILNFFFDALTPAISDGLGYGFAIVLLTVLINLVVFPLTLKQTRATRAFTEIQPEIKRIQKEYKEDPQEMQRRLMELQRSAGATPGGCLLPLLVQMPIWFALFRLLQTPLDHLAAGSALAAALSNGSEKLFLGMDLGTTPATAVAIGLTSALPYLIMLALMVATQYVQQWHATYGQERPQGPQAGAQQAITKIMPLFIGFISYNFPAGLVLYWATSNLFRLGQQALIFKLDGRPTPGGKPEPAGDEDQERPEKKTQQGAADKRRRRRRR